MYIFLVFDLFITIGLIQGYLYKRVNVADMRNILFVLYATLFGIYSVFGAYIVFKAMFIRYSEAGQVCSGDFLLPDDDLYEKKKDYFMKYEGNFITIIFCVESVCFIVMSVTFILTVLIRQQMELQYGEDLFRKRQTIIPNFKNYKNIKYATKIVNLYTIEVELGQGAYGTVHRVRNNKTQ